MGYRVLRLNTKILVFWVEEFKAKLSEDWSYRKIVNGKHFLIFSNENQSQKIQMLLVISRYFFESQLFSHLEYNKYNNSLVCFFLKEVHPLTFINF